MSEQKWRSKCFSLEEVVAQKCRELEQLRKDAVELAEFYATDDNWKSMGYDLEPTPKCAIQIDGGLKGQQFLAKYKERE